MGKYIDADRLRAEIEKIYKSEIQPWLSGVSATSAIYDYVLPLIDSLQQEQPELPPIEYAKTYYQKGLHDGIIKGQMEILKRLEEIEKRKADPVIVIKQQEQPDFPTTDEEIERLLATNPKVEVPNKYKTPDWLWKKQEQSDLPSDLDKAARKSAVAPFNFELDEEHIYEYPYLPIAEQKFKEGAEWMAGQGVSYQAVISADKTIPVLPMKDVSDMGLDYGDKVIVQIRKIE